MKFFFLYLLALFCLFVKNIVENDRFFFSWLCHIVSTFYTLIYKLYDFFPFPYACPSDLSNYLLIWNISCGSLFFFNISFCIYRVSDSTTGSYKVIHMSKEAKRVSRSKRNSKNFDVLPCDIDRSKYMFFHYFLIFPWIFPSYNLDSSRSFSRVMCNPIWGPYRSQWCQRTRVYAYIYDIYQTNIYDIHIYIYIFNIYALIIYIYEIYIYLISPAIPYCCVCVIRCMCACMNV